MYMINEHTITFIILYSVYYILYIIYCILYIIYMIMGHIKALWLFPNVPIVFFAPMGSQLR